MKEYLLSTKYIDWGTLKIKEKAKQLKESNNALEVCADISPE